MKRLLAAVACWFRGHRFPTAFVGGGCRAWFYCTRGCGAAEEARPIPTTASAPVEFVVAESF